MKNAFLILGIIFGSLLSMNAQKIAVVDINAVLADMSAYQQAQAELDKVAADWRQEIAQQYDEIKSMYNKYQAEQVLLSEEEKIEREEEKRKNSL